MGFIDLITNSITIPAEDLLVGGAIGALFIAIIVIAVIFGLAVYIYTAITWQKIARRQKHKYPWLAWIPFARGAMILQMGRFGWGWIFLVLIPIAGWIALAVLLTIAMWRIFEKEKYPGWLSLSFGLSMVPKLGVLWILYLVVLGLVAWKKRK